MAKVQPAKIEELTREDFYQFFEARDGSKINAYDPWAHVEARMDEAKYKGVLKHYLKLKEMYG